MIEFELRVSHAMCICVMVPLFNVILILINIKAILVEGQQCSYSTNSWVNKRVHNVLKKEERVV